MTSNHPSHRDAFTFVGERQGLLVLLIEDDFWICWTPERLFVLSGSGERLLFKGSTSLCDIYSIIQRFSKDIGLSLSRTTLGG